MILETIFLNSTKRPAVSTMSFHLVVLPLT